MQPLTWLYLDYEWIPHYNTVYLKVSSLTCSELWLSLSVDGRGYKITKFLNPNQTHSTSWVRKTTPETLTLALSKGGKIRQTTILLDQQLIKNFNLYSLVIY